MKNVSVLTCIFLLEFFDLCMPHPFLFLAAPPVLSLSSFLSVCLVFMPLLPHLPGAPRLCPDFAFASALCGQRPHHSRLSSLAWLLFPLLFCLQEAVGARAQYSWTLTRHTLAASSDIFPSPYQRFSYASPCPRSTVSPPAWGPAEHGPGASLLLGSALHVSLF